jgi:hypothetical protein
VIAGKGKMVLGLQPAMVGPAKPRERSDINHLENSRAAIGAPCIDKIWKSGSASKGKQRKHIVSKWDLIFPMDRLVR